MIPFWWTLVLNTVKPGAPTVVFSEKSLEDIENKRIEAATKEQETKRGGERGGN
jgi:hypothetical protein